MLEKEVPRAGLEPACGITTSDFKSPASANSAIPALGSERLRPPSPVTMKKALDRGDATRHLRTRTLGAELDGIILRVDQDDLRFMNERFFLAHFTEARDDRDIARVHMVRRGTVHADHARTSRTTERVG